MGKARVVGTGPKTRQVGTQGRSLAYKQQGVSEKTRVAPGPFVDPHWTRCMANSKAGTPCKAPNLRDQKYCVGHARAEAMTG
jgi:hypothetical protein